MARKDQESRTRCEDSRPLEKEKPERETPLEIVHGSGGGQLVIVGRIRDITVYTVKGWGVPVTPTWTEGAVLGRDTRVA